MTTRYGLNGCFDNAVEWLEHMGDKGVNTLSPKDRKEMTEAGIIGPDNKVNDQLLKLTLHYLRHDTILDTEDPSAINAEEDEGAGLPLSHSHAHEQGFGTDPTHPHRRH